jgi:hypothetical protein
VHAVWTAVFKKVESGLYFTCGAVVLLRLGATHVFRCGEVAALDNGISRKANLVLFLRFPSRKIYGSGYLPVCLTHLMNL